PATAVAPATRAGALTGPDSGRVSWAGRRGRGGNEMHACRRRYTHVQTVCRDFFYAGMHCPGALFQLQLAVFDFELLGYSLLILQLDEKLPRLVLRSYQRERADHQDRR